MAYITGDFGLIRDMNMKIGDCFLEDVLNNGIVKLMFLTEENYAEYMASSRKFELFSRKKVKPVKYYRVFRVTSKGNLKKLGGTSNDNMYNCKLRAKAYRNSMADSFPDEVYLVLKLTEKELKSINISQGHI